MHLAEPGRLRFLLRLDAPGVPREKLLGLIRALGGSVGADVRNPKWTSHGALEVDAFCQSKSDFDLFTSALEPLAKVEFTRDLNVAPPHMSEEELVSEARQYFNSERYWECHEVLEGLWRTKGGDEKRLLQGMILVCAAFVHHQKEEDRIALGVLGRGQPLLDYPVREYHGIDVEAVRHHSVKIVGEQKFYCFRI